MKAPGIGILGIGCYLPPEIRQNSFWPESVVRRFHENGEMDLGAPPPSSSGGSDTLQSIISEEMGKWKHDPFHGIVERRVVKEGVRSSDLEVLAARDALANAGLEPKDIGLLMVQSVVPDHVGSTNPATVHHRLGLPTSCAAYATDQTCGGVMFQLELAAALIKAGGARHVLLVQSALQSRILDYATPLSTVFGDAVSAFVVGPVEPSRGILSIRTFSDGRFAKMAVLTAPSADWWQSGGPFIMRPEATGLLKEVPLATANAARDSIGVVLDEAGVSAKEVDLFLSHQPTSSFNAICRRSAGLDHVGTVDTFAKLGAMSSCVIPVNLRSALEQKRLRDDQIVVLFTTGAGINWGAAVLRWGL